MFCVRVYQLRGVGNWGSRVTWAVSCRPVALPPLLAPVYLQKNVWKWKQNPDQRRCYPFFGALWNEDASILSRIFWGNDSLSFLLPFVQRWRLKAFTVFMWYFKQFPSLCGARDVLQICPVPVLCPRCHSGKLAGRCFLTSCLHHFHCEKWFRGIRTISTVSQ